MKVTITQRILKLMLAGMLCSTLAIAAPDSPEDTVIAFNAAFMARDKDAAIATLAQGGAQFTLRSQHEEAPPDSLHTNIADYWALIAPVLFASTSSYQREIEILAARADGDVATVWTNTRTQSTRLGATEPDLNTFTEVYLLIKTADGWKIAAIADNRQATKHTDD